MPLGHLTAVRRRPKLPYMRSVGRLRTVDPPPYTSWPLDRVVGGLVLTALGLIGAYLPVWPGLGWGSRWEVAGSLLLAGAAASRCIVWVLGVLGDVGSAAYAALASLYVVVADLGFCLISPVQPLALVGPVFVFLVYFKTVDRERLAALARWHDDDDVALGPIEEKIATALVGLIGWTAAMYWYFFFRHFVDRRPIVAPLSALSPVLISIPFALLALAGSSAKLSAHGAVLSEAVIPLYVASVSLTLFGATALSLYSDAQRRRRVYHQAR